MAESPEKVKNLLWIWKKKNQLPKRICRSNGFHKNRVNRRTRKMDGAYYSN
jgi:hypothetical protein